MGYHYERGADPVEVAAVTGGDGEIEGGRNCLRPGNRQSAILGEKLVNAMRKRRGLRPGEDNLDPRVGFERGQNVKESGHRRDVMDNSEHGTLLVKRNPASGVRADGNPGPRWVRHVMISCRGRSHQE
ncbi:conserved hypothetical protein [Frankia sp. AiPs1]